MTFRFGEFRLDTGRRELRRGLEHISLAPKAFDLLQTLVERHPRAVSQQELYDRLWPDTFVKLTNLHNLVHQLREALEDHDHRVIRTVYGFGFAFAATIASDAVASRCRVIVGEREIDLVHGENIVGRAREARVRIEAPSVSRHHAKIVVDGGTAILEDLGSKNGTVLRGKRIHVPSALRDGDAIVFGEIAARFETSLLEPSTETLRS